MSINSEFNIFDSHRKKNDKNLVRRLEMAREAVR
jgi:hypothetical protein